MVDQGLFIFRAAVHDVHRVGRFQDGVREIGHILRAQYSTDTKFSLFTVLGFQHREDERYIFRIVEFVVIFRLNFLVKLIDFSACRARYMSGTASISSLRYCGK